MVEAHFDRFDRFHVERAGALRARSDNGRQFSASDVRIECIQDQVGDIRVVGLADVSGEVDAHRS